MSGESRVMPEKDESEKTKYAGRSQKFRNKSVMILDGEYEVVIVDYQKIMGLYIVFRPDRDFPLFRVSPARLRRKELSR